MPRPSKMTPKKLEAVRGARARGAGLREAARDAGVSPETARAWERRDVARRVSTKKKPAPKIAAPAETEIAAILDAPPPSGLEEVRSRLTIVRALVERLIPAVEAEEFSPGSFVTISKYCDDLARLLVELTPPAPKNPDEDPSVLEAARVLAARFESMVADAEKELGR